MPDEQRDFFISFNSADEAYAKTISDALRAEGFSTFFHPDDLEPGGYIPKWMNDALLNSKQMLALCSPEYMNEGAVFSEAERYMRLWQDTRWGAIKLIPVVLRDTNFPPLLAPYKRVTATNMTPAEAAATVVEALKRPEEIYERSVLREVQPGEPVRQGAYVDTMRLPETTYERLVGRKVELERLDTVWLDGETNILSIVAEGGVGKSALVNEWTQRIQQDNYLGAEMVLGWSFNSQDLRDSAPEADEFLNWALSKFGIKLRENGSSAKAEAIAEAMAQRRVLLLLDGVEPLLHKSGEQLGQLKDQGLRALLRRFATTTPSLSHGLIVLTSRLPIKDIARWRRGTALVIEIKGLSDEAGTLLLRDNGADGSNREMRKAVHELAGHPLALQLVGQFIARKHDGDIQKRGSIRPFLEQPRNRIQIPLERMLESFETKFLDDPSLLSLLYLVGLFNRGISAEAYNAMRQGPTIEGLPLPGLGSEGFSDYESRLQHLGLLQGIKPASTDVLDAHPLVREWFGERFRARDAVAWQEASRRRDDFLRGVSSSLIEETQLHPPEVPLPAPSPATQFTYADGQFDLLPSRAWHNREGQAAIYHQRAGTLANALADRLGNTDAVPDVAASVNALIDVLGETVDELQPDLLRLASRSIAAKARAFGHPAAALEISVESVSVLFELADVLVDLQSFVRSDLEQHENAIRQLELTPESVAEGKEALDFVTEGILANRHLMSERAEVALESAASISAAASSPKVQVAIEGDRILITSNLALAVARELGRADAGQIRHDSTNDASAAAARKSSSERKRRTVRSATDKSTKAAARDSSPDDFARRIIARIERKGPDAIGDAVVEAAVSTIRHTPKTIAALGAILVLWPALDPLVLGGGTIASILAWIGFRLRQNKPDKG
jgi:hypothetical protein